MIPSPRSSKFDVCKSVHHHTIQINQPTRCNSSTSLLLDVFAWLNMFRAPPCPSSGAYNCISSLWFYRWSVVVAVLLVIFWPKGQTTTNSTATVAFSWLIYLNCLPSFSFPSSFRKTISRALHFRRALHALPI
jgi:hypothetical protein